MTTYQLLCQALKGQLKKRRIKYKDLAKDLGKTEVTLKRMMTAEDGSLGRIEEITRHLGISLLDLMAVVKEEAEEIYYLSEGEEKFFSKNLHYFYFLTLLNDFNYSVEDIRSRFRLNKKSLHTYLKKLEDMGLIDWLPGDQARVKIHGGIALKHDSNFAWELASKCLRGVSDFVVKKNMLDLLKGNKSYFSISEVLCSKKTREEFTYELQQISKRFYIQATRDQKLVKREDLVESTFMLSLLPDIFTFDDLPNL